VANGKARRYATRTPLQDYSFFVGKYKSPLKSCAVSDIFKPGGAVSVDLDQGVGIELGFLGKVLPVEGHEMIPPRPLWRTAGGGAGADCDASG